MGDSLVLFNRAQYKPVTVSSHPKTTDKSKEYDNKIDGNTEN